MMKFKNSVQGTSSHKEGKIKQYVRFDIAVL